MTGRRWLILFPLIVGCRAMDFEFSYAFSGGVAETDTTLEIRGGMGTLVRQSGTPIGVWQGPVRAVTAEALWREMPAEAPKGFQLQPGMPNHLLRMKRGGVEKTVRLAHEPEVLEQVAGLIGALEEAMKQAGQSPVRTVSIRFGGWTAGGAVVELTAAGVEDVWIPDAAAAVELRCAPAENRNRVEVAAKPAAGELRIPAGQTRALEIATVRQAGMVYQARYRRRGRTAAGGGEIFGETSTALAPQ